MQSFWQISRFTRTVESNGKTIVATTVPERTWSSDEERSKGASSFACNFGFQQRYKRLYEPLIDPLYVAFEDELNPQNSEKYIVQGSNTIEPFKNIEIETTSDIPSTETLENAAQDTTEDNTPFTNFPG